MRCSIGRHREEADLQVDDDELVAAAVDDLRAATGLSATPVDRHVQRWGGALPQYAVGHLDRVATVRATLDRLPGLAVCGAAYDGLGIPACISSAGRAAAKVLADLAAVPAAPRETMET
jgi:oxygen-dependent protoporphyrinogen oxidase